MALLAKRPGEIVTREAIYAHLWADFSNPGNSSNPYDRQISDHKRKITIQIEKTLTGKSNMDLDQVKDLIKTRRKVGYLLNLNHDELFVMS